MVFPNDRAKRTLTFLQCLLVTSIYMQLTEAMTLYQSCLWAVVERIEGSSLFIHHYYEYTV